jgi:hypothetical protein
MFEKTSKTNVLFNNFLQHTIMQESIASSPRPSKGGMQQIGCVSDRNPYTPEWQNVVDHMQMGVEKTPIPQKYAEHEGYCLTYQYGLFSSPSLACLNPKE